MWPSLNFNGINPDFSLMSSRKNKIVLHIPWFVCDGVKPGLVIEESDAIQFLNSVDSTRNQRVLEIKKKNTPKFMINLYNTITESRHWTKPISFHKKPVPIYTSLYRTPAISALAFAPFTRRFLSNKEPGILIILHRDTNFLPLDG